MNKTPSFIIRYANYRIDNIMNNELMEEENKNQKLKKIYKAISNFQFGLTTIDETMQAIVDA